MQIWLQRLIPQHWLSRFVGSLADYKGLPSLKNWAIRRYVKFYGVNMSEAEPSDYKQFNSFNEFFIRPLKPNCRPMPSDPKSIVSPVDGTISEIGVIKEKQILQAKGIYYDLEKLLAGDLWLTQRFYKGAFFTAYLAPKDYHRIHMPMTGRLLAMYHVPGKLFSVNPYTVSNLPGLFAKNERIICVFDTAIGYMIVIAVGAVIVGSIATVWYGIVTPPTRKQIQHWDYQNRSIELARGEEMGYFKLGSTVIVLFESDRIRWLKELTAGKTLKIGQVIATF